MFWSLRVAKLVLGDIGARRYTENPRLQLKVIVFFPAVKVNPSKLKLKEPEQCSYLLRAKTQKHP